MSKIKFSVFIFFLVIWTVLTILATTWGTRFDWPDNVHIDHGFPLVWTTQTLSTIIGPVDLWKVNISALILDLTFWLAIMLIVASIMLYFFNRELSD